MFFHGFGANFEKFENFERIEAFRHYSLACPDMEVRSGLANAILNGLLQLNSQFDISTLRFSHLD